MDNKNVIFNFGLTLKNYDELMEYLEERDMLNDEKNLDILNFYESFLFELSIREIGKLHHVIKEQNDKYMKLLIQVGKAETIVNELIKEMAKKASDEAEKEKIRKEQEELKKNQSFIKNLKDKISKFFSE